MSKPQKALERIVRNASERVIIHSTFVTDAGAEAILPLLLQASAKGVLIDVLWGQDDVGTTTNSSQAAAQRMKARIADAGRSDLIRSPSVFHKLPRQSRCRR